MTGIYEEFGFVSGWIGIVWCIISFILLGFKANELITKIKTNDESNQFKQDTTFLLINSFGSCAFTLIYCTFYATIGTKPNDLNIILTQDLCQYTAQYMANAGWQFARYFFYNFMLWRIRASFSEPEELKLSTHTFRIYLVLIHIWLIFGLTITIFFTPRVLTPEGNCGVAVRTLFPGFTTTNIRTVIWAYDLLLTIGLLLLFLRRLGALTQQNQTINAYRRKTIVFGILATCTSICIALCTYFMVTKEWRFFIPLDLIINLSCIVFTFKFSIDTMCPRYYNKLKGHEDVKQETQSSHTAHTTTNDREVWNMLVRAEGPGNVEMTEENVHENQPLNTQ
eukprot:80394_1